MIEVKEEYNDEIKAGNVIRTDPEIGSIIDTDDIPESIILYVSKGPEPTEKVMPDIYKYSKEEAEKLLEELGIKYTYEETYSAEVEVGKVVKTSVEAGDTFFSDEEVIVYFSKGITPGAVNFMPNCIGMQADEAKATIAQTLGILESRIQVIEVPNESIPAGQVYNTNPPAGVEIANPGSVNIALYVSKGDEPEALDAIMPDVIYETIETARARLYEAGFKNIIEMPAESSEPVGTVVDANYTVGAIVKENVNIVLYVSKGISGGAASSIDALIGEAGYN